MKQFKHFKNVENAELIEMHKTKKCFNIYQTLPLCAVGGVSRHETSMGQLQCTNIYTCHLTTLCTAS